MSPSRAEEAWQAGYGFYVSFLFISLNYVVHGHGWVWCHGAMGSYSYQDGDIIYTISISFRCSQPQQPGNAMHTLHLVTVHPIHPTWRCVIIWRNASQTRYNWMEPVLETVTRILCNWCPAPDQNIKTSKQNKLHYSVFPFWRKLIAMFPIHCN